MASHPHWLFWRQNLASPPPFPPFKGGVTFTTVLLRAKLIPQTLYLYVTPLVAAGMPVQPPRACQQAPKPSGHFSHSVLTKLFRSSHITTLWRIAHPLAVSPVTTLLEGEHAAPRPAEVPGGPLGGVPQVPVRCSLRNRRIHHKGTIQNLYCCTSEPQMETDCKSLLLSWR